MSVTAGLFHDGSLLRKSAANTLTADQVVRYKAALSEHDRVLHADNIQQFIGLFERSERLPESRRQQLTAILTKEIEPSPCHVHEGLYYLFFGLDRIQEDKLKPLFRDADWQLLNQYREQSRHLEPMLRQAGILPNEAE